MPSKLLTRAINWLTAACRAADALTFNVRVEVGAHLVDLPGGQETVSAATADRN